jgi:hypothetical protein
LIAVMPQLSEWLQIMLTEIARKQEEARLAKEEQQRKPDTSTDSPHKPPSQHKYLSTHV